MSIAPSARGRDKRDKALAAARVLFLRHGLRATTMEAIAREAGIAKPTLYAHFPDKDAVFLAILERLLADKVAAFEAALAGEGSVAVRVGKALAAEFDVIATAIGSSPHADELFAAHRQAADMFRQSDMRVAELLTAELSAAGVADAARLARLLRDASFGLAHRAIGRPDLGTDIALLCERLIAPELG